MKVLDLFSGIGGFSLGLERAGMETVAFCEIEDYPVSILNKHWPAVPVHRDIRKLNGKQYRDSVDVVCGGFPCQPFSVAGKQKGKEDDRHLWPEMLRIIKESKPTWVIGENVAGFIRMALDDVLLDLETEGYTTQSFVIPACAVGANHRRDRVWIIAYSESEQNRRLQQREFQPDIKSEGDGLPSNSEHNGRNGSEDGQGNSSRNDGDSAWPNEVEQSTRPSGEGESNVAHSNSELRPPLRGECEVTAGESSQQRNHGVGGESDVKREESIRGTREDSGNVADTDNERLQRTSTPRHTESEGQKALEQFARLHDFFRREFEPLGVPTESPVRHRDDGVSDRVARLKALGNAVVPQVPEVIGRYIMAVEEVND